MTTSVPNRLPSGRNSTAEKLLVAASELMIERSSIEISLSDIAQKSGANAALVKYHFGNKDGLLLALLARDAATEMSNLEYLLAQPIAVASGMVRGFNRTGLPALPRQRDNLLGGLGEKELNLTGQGLWKCRRIAGVVGASFCTVGEDGLDASDIAAAQAHSHPHRVQILACSGKSLNGGGDVGIGVFLGAGHPDRVY